MAFVSRFELTDGLLFGRSGLSREPHASHDVVRHVRTLGSGPNARRAQMTGHTLRGTGGLSACTRRAPEWIVV
jgi:hypothetical protein